MKTDLAVAGDRARLARDLRRTRKNERKLAVNGKFFKRRDRTLRRYRFYLAGLDATLDYVATLSSRQVVDLGAGTGRALRTLERVKHGKKLAFVGTGIIWDTSIVFRNYRLTPAELMCGFPPESVGAFISVFGPIHYSNAVELVLENIHRLLAPGGVVKLAVADWQESNPPDRNSYLRLVNGHIARFFRERNYGFAFREVLVPKDKWKGLALLAVKPRARRPHPVRIARRLMAADYENAPRKLPRRRSKQ